MKPAVCLLPLFLLVAACGTENDPSSPASETTEKQYGEVVRSSELRNLSPDVTATDLGILVAGNRNFAVDLYHELILSEGGNLFFSPQSVSQALAMTFAGARLDTEAQMASTLSFDLDQDNLHPTFNALDLAL